VNGIAYVNDGSTLDAIDLVSGQVVQSIQPEGANAGPITGLAVEGSMLYVMDNDGNNRLSVVDISSGQMVLRGSTTVPLINNIPGESGKITVGNGIAYVNDGAAGYVTIDVSNPDAPTVLASGSFSDGIVGDAMAINGSGLAVTVGQLRFTPGSPILFDVLNASNPTTTNQFITSFTLPANPFDVAIGEGTAFVADGTGGLQIVNYEATDTKGVAPTIQVLSTPTSINPSAPGVQLVEGQQVSFNVKVADDVQVRNVELVATATDPVTGLTITTVLQNSVTFPFNISGVLPTISELDGATNVTLQVRATDTGGNIALSSPFNVTLVPDTTPLTLVSQSLHEGDIRTTDPGQVVLTLSKPVTELEGGSFVLVGPNGTQIPLSVGSHDNGKTVEIAYNQSLAPGQYKLEIDTSTITDATGNTLGTSVLTTDFTVEQFTDKWIGPVSGGSWEDAANWSAGRVPTATDDVFIGLGNTASLSVTGNESVHSLALVGGGTLSVLQGSLNVADAANVQGTLDIATGTTFVADGMTGLTNLQIGPGGTLAGTGTVAITGTATVENALMLGSGTTIIQGVLNIAGQPSGQGISALGLDDGRVLENQGTINWLGGNINLNNNDTGEAAAGTIRNDAGATFNAAPTFGGSIFANQFADGDTGQSALFDNKGSLNTGGTGGFSISTAFTNSGTITVAAGDQLSIAGNVSIGGTVTGAGSIEVTSGSVSIAPDATYTVAETGVTGGTLTITGTQFVNTLSVAGPGTIVANGALEVGTLNIGTFRLEGGGTLAGTGTVTVLDQANVSDGQMIGPGRTIIQGTLTISTPPVDPSGLGMGLDDGRVLENQGIVNWTAGNIDLNPDDTGNPAAGMIINDAQGTFNAMPSGGGSILAENFGDADDGQSAAFDNRGTMIVSGQGGIDVFVLLTNSGTIDVQGSFIELNGGGTQSGLFTGTGAIGFGGNGTFDFTATSVINAALVDFQGSGVSANLGGTISVASGNRLSIFGNTFDITGTIAGSGRVAFGAASATIESTAIYTPANTNVFTGTLTIAGARTLAALGISGDGTVVDNDSLTLGSLSLDGGILTGSGVVTVTGTTDLSGGALIGTGTMIAQGGLTIEGSGITLAGGWTLENQGVANWFDGAIQFGLVTVASTSTGSSLKRNSATLLDGILQNDAGAVFNIDVNDPSLTTAQMSCVDGPSAALFNNQGTVNQTGGAPASIGVTFFNSGIVNVGDGVSEEFTGPFTNTGTVVLGATATFLVDADPAFGSLQSQIVSGLTPGKTPIQIMEGSTVSFALSVTDKATIANVKLVSINPDGTTTVLATSTGAPFNLSAMLPTLQANSPQLTLQIRATDNLGVVRLSDPINLQLTPANVPLALVSQNIHNGDALTTPAPQFVFNFSAPLDPNTVNASTFALIGPNGVVLSTADIRLADFNRQVVITYAPLQSAGQYSFRLDATKVTDKAGNPLGTDVLTTQFSETPQFSDTWIGATGGDWNNAANWSAGAVPTANDDVLISLGPNQTVTYDSTIASVHSLVMTGGATLSVNSGQLSTTSYVSIDGTLSVAGEFDNDGVAVIGSLSLGGVLGGAGKVTVTGATTVTGGEMKGTGTTVTQGSLSIAASANADPNLELVGMTLDGGHLLINQGQATWTSGDINLQGADGSEGMIRNEVGATFTSILSDFTFLQTNNDRTTTLFDNRGTFVIAGSSGPNISVGFQNDGLVDSTEGQNFGGGVPFQGSVTGNGEFKSDGGVVFFFNDLDLTGSITTTQQPPEVEVIGNTTLESSAVCSVTLSNTSGVFGINSDILITGAAALNGTLNVNLPPNFTATLGSRFVVLEADGGISGAFSTINLPQLGNGMELVLDASNPNQVAFVVTSSGKAAA